MLSVSQMEQNYHVMDSSCGNVAKNYSPERNPQAGSASLKALFMTCFGELMGLRSPEPHLAWAELYSQAITKSVLRLFHRWS